VGERLLKDVLEDMEAHCPAPISLRRSPGHDAGCQALEELASQAPIVPVCKLDSFFKPSRPGQRQFTLSRSRRIQNPVPRGRRTLRNGTATETLGLPVISRIKVMSNLNIAERRLPQDGRIQLNMAGRQVDLRVSTLPTQYGESVVYARARSYGR